MPGILILDELQSATEGGGIKLKDPLQTQDGTPLLSPSGEVSINFDNLANNTIHMNKLNIPNDAMSGDKIHGGTISGSFLDGIKLNSSGNSITKSDGITSVLSESGGVVTVDADNFIIDNAGKISSVGQIELQIDTDNNQSGTYIGFSRNNTTSERLALFQENGDISFYEDTGTTPKFFWDASAESLGIGTINPTEKLTVSGNITASGDVTSTSDVRVKTDIKPITGALDIVNKLEGKRFNKFNKPGIGFIAQELEQYMPELVHTANDEVGTKSVNYANMVALLVEAIKEQQVTINKLESKLNGN